MESINKDGELILSDDDGSFPSLDFMHYREQNDIEYGATTTVTDGIESFNSTKIRIIDACGMENTSVVDQLYNSHDDEATLDGYPTDEQTIGSYRQLTESEKERLNTFKLARRRVATEEVVPVAAGDEDNYFLVNADVVDASLKQPPNESDREQYVFEFSLLTTVNGEEVEEHPDDSSFIVGAAVVEDVVPDDYQSMRHSKVVDSCYDLHASTLSRATESTHVSILKEQSNIPAQLVRGDANVNRNLEVEDQSVSTYLYGQANYAENATLASNYTSNFSALTEDYSFPAQMTEISEAMKGNEEGPSFSSLDTPPRRGGERKRISHSDLSDQTTEFRSSENPDQPTKGYVDEAAAHNFATPNRCCGWLTSSSQSFKLGFMFSILLLLLCGAGVAFALLFPETNVANESSSINEVCVSGAPCSKEGLRCNDGTTESCCGETYYSFVCDCLDVDGELRYASCIDTDVCVDPSCESLYPEVGDDIEETSNETETSETSTETPTRINPAADWKDLSEEIQHAFGVVGYNETTWNSGIEPHSSGFSWDDLTPEQRKAALFIGYTEELWDTNVDTIADVVGVASYETVDIDAAAVENVAVSTNSPTTDVSSLSPRNPTYVPTPTIRPTPTSSEFIITRNPTLLPVSVSFTSNAPTRMISFVDTDVTTSPSSSNPSSPISFPVIGSRAVPPGCAATDDIILASQKALIPEQSNTKLYVAFPPQDASVGGGIYSDEMYGSYDALALDSSNTKVTIEFDLGLLAVTSGIEPILSATLRLFVLGVQFTTSLTVSKQSIESVEDGATVTPTVTKGTDKTFTVTSTNDGQWLDVDVTDFIDLNQIKKFVIAIETDSSSGQCVFAGHETCHSSKLVVITKSDV